MPLTRRGRVVLGLATATTLVGAALLVRHHEQVVLVQSCTARADGRDVVMTPEQMASAATISGVAVRRGLPARAATIAIATAIQESKLRNIDYGDRDSLGLFQQRPSQGWGTPAQVQDPVYATNKFYDALVEVRGYQQLPVTQAAQRVQRSAFPDAYADHEADARVLASVLTGQTQGALTCELRGTDDSGRAGSARLQALAGAATARARAVTLRDADGADVGLRLDFATRGGDLALQRRQAWAAAAWAVAHAAQVGAERVYVDGRVWRRSAPADGFAPLTGGERGEAAGGAGVAVLTADEPVPAQAPARAGAAAR